MIFTILGNCPSGKNKILVTRDGRHIPGDRFVVWRKDAFIQLKAQRQIPKRPIDWPVKLKVDYWPGDRLVRDITGMADALFHLLVYAGVLKDDGFVYDLCWYRQQTDRKFPKVRVEVLER